MIANGLIFLLGALLATLVALLLTPIVWRKAQALARREFEATIPMSANEIRAEFDRVRAEAALTVRRHEVLTAQARDKTGRTQAELGRSTVESTELLKRSRQLSQALAAQEQELAALRMALAQKDEEREKAERDLIGARRESDMTAEELEALARRFQEIGEIAEERQIQLVAGETRFDRASDALRASERAARDARGTIERLRSENARLEASLKDARAGTEARSDDFGDLAAALPGRDPAPAPAPAEPAAVPAEPDPNDPPAADRVRPPGRGSWGRVPANAADPDGALPNGGARLPRASYRLGGSRDSSSDEAEIRERISDIAARVIHMTAAAEGASSPIPNLLSGLTEPGNVGEGAGGHPSASTLSLAERVRLLAAAENRGGLPGDADGPGSRDQDRGPPTG